MLGLHKYKHQINVQPKMSEVNHCEDYQTLKHIKEKLLSEKGSHLENLLADKMTHKLLQDWADNLKRLEPYFVNHHQMWLCSLSVQGENEVWPGINKFMPLP